MKGYKMDIRPIHNRRDHKAALTEIERHWDAPAGSPQADRLEVLALLVEHYEKQHDPIDDVDPIELIQHVMQSRGLARKDLEPMIGPRGRVADILNRTRPLTLPMIRRLAHQLDLPADLLVKPYAIRSDRVAA
jgi:HTH-type transcriptional regulator/antitoxin HigA